MTSNFVQRELSKIFQTALLPWAKSGVLRAVIADPAWPMPDRLKVTAREPILAAPQPSRNLSDEREWPDLGLYARNYPFLICVLDGEADICVGSLREPSANEEEPGRKYDVHVFTLPRQTCLVVPAGVPFPTVTSPHWERPNIERASSHLLWIMVQPVGAFVYTCRTTGLSHAHGAALLTQDAKLSTLTRLFIETAQSSPESVEVINSYLLTLLLCINENWSHSQLLERNEGVYCATAAPGPAGYTAAGEIRSATLERVCHYIQTHMIDELSLAQIARETYVSIPQLKRLFREHLNTSVMKYVTQCRLEEAKALLAGTSFTVQQIGEICGYPHRAHFTKAFTQWTGVSPREFRHGAQNSDEKYAVRFFNQEESELNQISS